MVQLSSENGNKNLSHYLPFAQRAVKKSAATWRFISFYLTVWLLRSAGSLTKARNGGAFCLIEKRQRIFGFWIT
jgi:hypothetical protein